LASSSSYCNYVGYPGSFFDTVHTQQAILITWLGIFVMDLWGKVNKINK
jgi:hypothetical protein